MNAFDLMEALTDMDDEVLRRAETMPPRPTRTRPRWLRGAAAACLVMVLLLAPLAVVKVTAGDIHIRYTVRYHQGQVIYTFRGGQYVSGPIANYEPTWLPEGYYMVDRETSYGITEEDSPDRCYITFNNCDSVGNAVWLDYQIVRNTYGCSFRLPDEGNYTVQEVEIGDCAGNLYTFGSGEDCNGLLIWVDREDSVIFSILFCKISPADALKLARSVTVVG